MNNRPNGSLNFVFFLIFITASFDIFLNLKISGFSIRIVLVFMTTTIVLFFLSALVREKVTGKFLGIFPFLVWSIINFLFIPHTTMLSRNIGYFAWLMIYALFVFTTPFFINRENSYYKLLRYYLYSFFLIGIFGICQFALGLFGLSVLTTQWWKEWLPRVNGFSYEPSYFATYLLLGWTICLHFYIKKEFRVVSKNKLRRILFTLLIAILLSTSRMGIAFVAATVIYLFWPTLVGILKTTKIQKNSLLMGLFFFCLLSITLRLFMVYFGKLKFLFEGVGLFGTAAHSSTTRFKQFSDTLTVFWNSPFWGYSLGGLPSAIAQLYGIEIHTQEEAKNFEGMSVFAEILAAGGVIGLIFFCRYLYIFYKKINLVIRQLETVHSPLSTLLKGLVLSFTFELLILCFNQTILRPYVWVHIAILNAGYFIGREQLKNHDFNGNNI